MAPGRHVGAAVGCHGIEAPQAIAVQRRSGGPKAPCCTSLGFGRRSTVMNVRCGLCAGTLVLGLAAALSPGCLQRVEQTPPNLLLIVIDTLRADHVGAYGYRLPTTPALDRLASGGIVFEQAVAQAPWTRPSMATVMTGLYPPTHGVTCKHFDVPQEQCDVLPAGVTTIAEALSARDYETAGIVANIQVDAAFGFAQGFDSYTNVFDDLAASDPRWREHWHEFKWVNETTPEVTNRAIAWLRSRKSERPFFLYLHYLDPHEPYRPPPPYDRMFDRASYVSPYREVLADLPLYDGEVRYVDENVKRVLDRLRGEGAFENTVIVVTADHGEAFGEHGALDRRHGLTLYENQLLVPLIMRIPGRGTGGIRVAEQVRLLDLAPTLLDLLGVSAAADMQGRSLVPLIDGRRTVPPAGLAGWGYEPLLAYRSPPWKLIRNTRTMRSELYDLVSDPGERTNLAAEQRQVVMMLGVQADEAVAAAVAAGRRYQRGTGNVTLSPEQRRGLRALGYLD